MATYLVTGGAGFIGSHIVERLLLDGQRVRVLDNFSSGSRAALAKFTGDLSIIEGDIRDAGAVRTAVWGVDYLIHLAAQVSVPASIEDPVTTEEVNSGGTLNALVAARDAGVKRFVLASSCAVYGDNPNLPLKEDFLPAPLSPYAITKLAGEYYCRVFYELYGLPTAVLRFLNVFGPGQRPDSLYAAAIPKFIDALANELAPTVFGDGEQTRDFIYVENVADAVLQACEANSVIGRVVNIGSGIETSLNNLLLTLEKIFGRKANAVYAAPRAGDIRRSVADITLARMLLDFSCRLSFEEGLKRTCDYFISLRNAA